MRTEHWTILVEARNANALRARLADIEIEVPPRHEGRTTLQVERYEIVHLLATLPSHRWTYPLTVAHRDRPDFFLVDGDGLQIAIECVEAVPENEAKKAFLRGRGHGPEMHFIERAVPGEKVRSTEQLLKEIAKKRPGEPWYGDSAEREWAAAMAHVAMEKAKSVANAGYERGDETWLLVYDNWPLPHVKTDVAARYFVTHAAFSEISDTFVRTFVMDGEGVWEFSAKGWDYHLLRSPREE